MILTTWIELLGAVSSCTENSTGISDGRKLLTENLLGILPPEITGISDCLKESWSQGNRRTLSTCQRKPSITRQVYTVVNRYQQPHSQPTCLLRLATLTSDATGTVVAIARWRFKA